LMLFLFCVDDTLATSACDLTDVVAGLSSSNE